MTKSEMEILIKGYKERIKELESDNLTYRNNVSSMVYEINTANKITDMFITLALEVENLDNGIDILVDAKRKANLINYSNREKMMDRFHKLCENVNNKRKK